MKIQKNIIDSLNEVVKKEWREHLKTICFEFDADKNELSMVGTDAQVMVVHTIKVQPDDVDLCKKWFDGSAYYLPDTKEKTAYVEIFEQDGRLMFENYVMQKFDGQYPNWKCVVPTKDLEPATQYCGWNPDLIKKADKVMGNKKCTIMSERPLVQATESEYRAPHVWNRQIDDWKTTLVVMPMKI